MPQLRVHNFCLSLDGFGAGPDQSREDPLGAGAERLHEWVFKTRTGLEMLGRPGGTTGLDDEFVARGFEGIGATVMGRNMFGPVRGPWSTDPQWSGWWGPNPPYHHPVFVLCHEPRPPLPMEGGTVFHFVTDGIEAALERALAAADGRDVRLGGGVSTIRQYLRAGLVDWLHLPIVPVLLGRGERLLDDGLTGYRTTSFAASDEVMHVVMERTAA
ncbi:dihydrofolate reductase family protein [Dactylosporangium vinaceum]|uniref:Deaminase reductase n=3 Tax=Dactylosporangium TaxID=35753 RepID=A0A9W6KCP0_9ACTN|nr:dihydrofolate reductase family protein [Dactylosporangium vinaceum]UAB93670.1 dihydrofolate reductase family protein [Dactylosporangium vinaceum]UWZ49872.1 dihydrofolate reductase family protein [Dactylosporangium matsuzakiense]GLK99670.1 deaminase reductase [Dactylosporangium matsuzakiense]